MSVETIQTGGEAEEVFIPDGPDRSDPAVAEALRNQFRMTRMQLYDWGTFSGVCDIPVSPRGYLILGPSGAGKSTILDAISALLVPPRMLDFNAASREAAKKGPDRNLLSYVRGAWAEQSDQEAGGTAVQYLRKGTSWSAIAITYESEAGRAVTLAQLFTLRGNGNSNADVKRLYMIFERKLSLTELEVFGQSNFDVRKLKQTFPEAHVRDEFSAYSERFCQLLGIESDRALKLLHKTQSAKALGDLDVFLREFMLDRPETFEAADGLVNEFGELNNAHQSVVTAREQVEVLRPARASYADWQDLGVALGETRGLIGAADPYREHMELLLSNQERDALTLELAGLNGVLTSQNADRRAQEQRQSELQQEFLQAGGSAVGQWKTEIDRLDAERAQCGQKRAKAESACKGLGLTLPASAEKFAEIGAQAQREGDAWREGAGQEDQGPRDQLVQKRAGIAGQLATDSEELKSLRGRRSSIPMKLVNLRNEIARELQISEASLPFVGELIEVKPDEEEAGWRGAIERVLGGTATDLLVDDHNYRAVVAYVNGRNLGLRLTYHRVRGEQATARPARAPDANSLVYKVNVDRGSPFAAWVQARLQDRFDYACVESVDAFRAHERAVTKEGQLKSGQRHEKDDRFAINDQSRWCLGFDNARKVAVFEGRIDGYRRALAEIDAELDKLARKQQERFAKVAHWSTLATLGWPDIDVESRTARIAELEGLIRDAESGDGALGELSRKLEAQKAVVTAAQRAVAATESKLNIAGEKIDKLGRRIAELEDSVDLGGVTEVQRQTLAERYAEFGEPVTLANLTKVASDLKLKLVGERGDIETRQAKLAAAVLAGFKTFRERWPMEAADLGSDIESASGYFAKLDRLEADDLPRHEARFFQLLRDQSSQGLTVLLQKITYAQANIQERMSRVNESLRRAEFNVGTYLQIEPKDRKLKEAIEFKQELQQARAPLAGDEVPEEAEARFTVLRALVTKLGSQDPALQRWRDAVLDVRQHFEFIGKELNLDDDSEVEVYRGSSGKSGGQKQKLTTTCLAAALRYQLGGDNAHGIPSFAPVVMDEAFDKADNTFTRLAMGIFTNFGFQMIVATPLKSVMTLERFIGGAGFVSIHDRKHSGVTLIEYDDERQRLNLPERAAKAIRAAEAAEALVEAS